MPLKPRNVIDADDIHVSRIGIPAPIWLMNYADLMTELVILFIILYALSAALSKDIQKAKEVVEKMMQEEKIQGETKIDKEGLHISLQEEGRMAFFESGKAELTPRMVEILDKLSPALKKLTENQDILVEGHTDNRPIATMQFASNWELSTARATNVVRYLVRDKKFPAEKLAAVGHGEYRPAASNDTPENQAKNRRVVFLIRKRS